MKLTQVSSSPGACGGDAARSPAYFDVRVSNRPIEAINGRPKRLRGVALGFLHYILRSPIRSGQLQERINAL